jgi:hypothetical protein
MAPRHDDVADRCAREAVDDDHDDDHRAAAPGPDHDVHDAAADGARRAAAAARPRTDVIGPACRRGLLRAPAARLGAAF